MKNLVIERIKVYMNAMNISSNEQLSKKIGANSQTVRQQMKGERALSLDVVLMIAYSFENLSLEWLLRGEGNMLKGECNTNNYTIKGTDNSVSIGGDSTGDINTNAGTDKELIVKLLEQNQQLIAILAKK